MDFLGGEFILPHVGHAFFGGPGYSVHGCLDILTHGVGQIRSVPAEPPTNSPPPICISLAMYPQANIFAGAARYSAQLKGQNQFSDSELWLPFYPRDFNYNNTISVIKAEGKRLHGLYRSEVVKYKEAQDAEKAAKKEPANEDGQEASTNEPETQL